MTTSRDINPAQFEKATMGDKRRFRVRILMGDWQVYATGLEHICLCDSSELAWMVADALERDADRQDGIAF